MSSLRVAAATGCAAAVLVTTPGEALPGPGGHPGGSPGGASAAAAPDGTSSAARRAFPVRGSTSYSSSHHDYPATDIFADCGRKIVSPITGTVLEYSRVDRWDPATDKAKHRGGKFFSIAGKGGVRYYGSHLRSLVGRIKAGAHIRAGQKVGRVGKTGNARYTSCHLHFGLSPQCRERRDWWIRRGVVSPYRFLRSWEEGGNANPRRAVKRWKRNHGCKFSDVFG